MWTKVQQTTKWIVALISIATALLLAGAKCEHAESEYAKSRADDLLLQASICTEREERRAEYMKLQIKLTALEVQMGRVEEGQTWMIMKMKEEI